LKPDVCRRVVGRLPSPHIQDNWQKSPWFQQRGMAPPFSLRFLPKKEEKFMVVYLVRSFRTYARIRSLTTGTFNLVVKDRITFRLSGANSVQANPHECESDCPRNLLNISSARNPVNACIPQHFHVFFHMGSCSGWAAGELNRPRRDGRIRPSGRSESRRDIGSKARNDIAFRSGFAKDAGYSAHAEAEDRKLRKDPSWRSLL